MKYLCILATVIFLQGCEPARNSPAEQVEDYAICKNAGMDSYLDSISRVKCKPPKVVLK